MCAMSHRYWDGSVWREAGTVRELVSGLRGVHRDSLTLANLRRGLMHPSHFWDWGWFDTRFARTGYSFLHCFDLDGERWSLVSIQDSVGFRGMRWYGDSPRLSSGWTKTRMGQPALWPDTESVSAADLPPTSPLARLAYGYHE